MKYIVLGLLILGFAICGCDPVNNGTAPEKTKTEDELETQREEEKGGYLGTVVRAPSRVKERNAVQNLQNQLNQYKALHGKWPDSLEELKAWTGGPLPQLPGELDYCYDPEKEEVKIIEAKR